MIIIDIKGPLVSSNDFKKPWTIKEIMDRWHKAFDEGYADLARRGIPLDEIRYNEQVEILVLVPPSCRYDLDNIGSTEKVIIDCLKDRYEKNKELKKMVFISKGIIPDDNKNYLVAMSKRFDFDNPDVKSLQVIISAFNRFDQEIETATHIDVTVPPLPESKKAREKRLNKAKK